MANRRCWLTKVVKVNGKWITRPVVFTPKGNQLTDRVLIEDREVPIEGVFVLEWWENGQRLRRRLGKDLLKAQTALTKHRMKMLPALTRSRIKSRSSWATAETIVKSA